MKAFDLRRHDIDLGGDRELRHVLATVGAREVALGSSGELASDQVAFVEGQIVAGVENDAVVKWCR